MKIEVLGSGCRKCNATFEAIRQAASDLHLEADLQKNTDLQALLRYQVMATPAVVVDGTLVHSGSVPPRSAIENWLSAQNKG